jgi:hypothetical protein
MTCGDWEERIALYAGGDLAETAELERHLAACPGCREAAAAYARNLEMLRQAHGESIPTAHYAAVRARVLAELNSGRRPVWRRLWVCAGAGAAVAMAFLLFPRQVKTPEPVGQPFQAAAALPGGVPEAAARVPPRKPSGPGSARVARARARQVVRPAVPKGRPGGPPHLEPLMVKLFTDDPNVIIYWIADGKGD